MIAYKKTLTNTLSDAQLSWCVGLALSDASIQANASQTNNTFRLKIQQSAENKPLLDVTQEFLKPWVFDCSEITDRNQYELQTIQHEAFNKVADIFTESSVIPEKSKVLKKVIPSNIDQYLDEVAVAAWFCGDGGRRDYGLNEGKAIQFHSQGFSKHENELLALALTNRYDLKAIAKLDYINNKNQTFYLIQVEASSFDSFMNRIEPCILPHFKKRLPKPRSENSRWAGYSGLTS